MDIEKIVSRFYMPMLWSQKVGGINCFAIQNHLSTGGVANGYCIVPQGHPWHGRDYDEIPVEIHGGLTYAEIDGGEWVIGFDVNHHSDNRYDNTLEWTIEETKKLAKQVKEAQQ